MVVVVVVAASEALSIYTKSGPFVRGKELSEVALPEPPKKRKPPAEGRVVFNVLGSLQTSPDFRRLYEATNNSSVHSDMA